MKKNKHLLLWAIACIATQLLHAQTAKWCATMENIERKAQNSAALQHGIEDMKTYLQNQQHITGQRSTEANTIYIPVVFHVVHNGDALGTGENITDAQCISQLDAMNKHYQGLDINVGNIPAVFASSVGNANIQFCLAKFDPYGVPTTGIIRHSLSNTSWDTNDDIDDILKPATIWDHNTYLNIWSVRMGGQLASDGVLGYSSLPFFGGANQDGVVARYNTVGTTGSLMASHGLGKTLTHEAGHWLGLLHIWGFDDACGDVGDYVPDTPDQADLNFGCPTFPQVSCNNGPDGDMFMNYMDYTDDACSYMFSNGQADRMRTIISDYRSGILSASTSCFYNLDAAITNISFPADTICAFTFKPVVTLRNEGGTTLTAGKLYVQLDNEPAQIINWNGSLPTLATEQLAIPVQEVLSEGVHTFSVTFGSANGQSADNFSGNDFQNVTFYAYNGAGAATLPFTENFELAFPQINWSMLNPNNDAVKWDLNTTNGGYGASSACIWINNRAYTSNPNKRKDAFVTDNYNFSAISAADLKFDVAYAKYSASRADSLNIYYSLDCGSNWTKLWAQKGADLATAADKTTLFSPAANEWKTVSVPVLGLANQNKVSFKFENVTGWGNAMYIDNINLQSNSALAVSNVEEKAAISVFPNPAGSMLGVRLAANHKFKHLQLYNNMGELVLDNLITDSAIILPVQNLANGIYLLHFKGENVSQTERVVISR